ncbi:MAG: MATE family efflux transporter [Lysobacterales bacterium]
MRQTFVLALPLIIGQISNVGMSFIDTLMAGRLSADALAAVAIGGTLWNSLTLFLIGTLLAVPAIISQLDGAGRRGRMGKVVRQALWLATFIGVAITVVLHPMAPLLGLVGLTPSVLSQAVEYVHAISWGAPGMGIYLVLRYFSDGLGLTRLTMYLGVAGMLLNIPADYLFMFGGLGIPAMGAKGTGYATALVLTCQALAVVLVVWRGKNYAQIGVFSRFESPSWGRIRQICRVGLPVGAAIFVESSMFVVSTLLMGSLGTMALAGHQIALNFSALLFMVPLALGMAITVRVGNAMGRGDAIQARQRGIAGLLLVLGTQVLSATIIWLFPHQITALYTQDVQVSAIAITLLFYSAIFQLSDGIQVAAAGALRGLKDTAVPMMMMIAAYWVVGIPLCYYLGITSGQGGAGVWIGLIAGLSVAAVALTIRFFQLTKLPAGNAVT